MAVLSKISPIPPSDALIFASKVKSEHHYELDLVNYENISEGVVDQLSTVGSHDDGVEAAMMEEVEFGNRLGKKDRHFLEKKFRFFPKELGHILEDCSNFYGISDNFPFAQLMIRSPEAKKIYIVSKPVMSIVLANDDRLRIVNMGLKLLKRHEGDIMRVGYRLCQESISFTFNFLSEARIVHIDHSDFIILLKEKDPFVGMFSSVAQHKLLNLGVGCCVFVIDDSRSPCDKMVFSGWRGKTSVHPLTTKQEVAALCNLFNEIKLAS